MFVQMEATSVDFKLEITTIQKVYNLQLAEIKYIYLSSLSNLISESKSFSLPNLFI